MTDTFRKVYKPLSKENQNLIMRIKLPAETLEELLLKISSREMSLAITNLEQCTIWATKAIVLDDEKSATE
jgi:hypothetical protein